MEIFEDFEEFFKLLNDHNVHYLVVGGYAFAVHARPRFTKDLDVWISGKRENADRLLTVLKDFGFGDLDIDVDETHHLVLCKDDTDGTMSF